MATASEIKPVIVIDSREQQPLTFPHLTAITAGLVSGDYSVAGLEGLFAVERKTVADLVGSVTSGRDRFERELIRLRGYRFRRLLIIGSEQKIIDHVSRIKKRHGAKANAAGVIGSIRAFEHRYDVPFVFCKTAKEAAEQVEVWAYYAAREAVKVADAVRKEMKRNDRRTDNDITQRGGA